jgi:hypothetical protein
MVHQEGIEYLLDEELITMLQQAAHKAVEQMN